MKFGKNPSALFKMRNQTQRNPQQMQWTICQSKCWPDLVARTVDSIWWESCITWHIFFCITQLYKS